jgi:hypothetical protein
LFQFPPVVDVLQEGVHPAVDDAVPAIELVDVVAMVLYVAEDQSRILEELDDGVGLRVDHVRPLVDLIGEDT